MDDVAYRNACRTGKSWRRGGQAGIRCIKCTVTVIRLDQAYESADPWTVDDAFLEAISRALPDWDSRDSMLSDLHGVLSGSLQVMASTAIDQGTHQVAGRHEMMTGINAIYDRRETERRKRAEEYQASRRAATATRAKRQARPKAALKKVASPPVVPREAPMAKSEPEPKPRSTAEIMRINAKRLREGKEPI